MSMNRYRHVYSGPRQLLMFMQKILLQETSVASSGAWQPQSSPSANPDNTEPCGTQWALSGNPACAQKHTKAVCRHAVCVYYHLQSHSGWSSSWVAGCLLQLQLAAENRGEGVWCRTLKSFGETADALLAVPPCLLFRGFTVLSHHSHSLAGATSFCPLFPPRVSPPTANLAGKLSTPLRRKRSMIRRETGKKWKMGWWLIQKWT